MTQIANGQQMLLSEALKLLDRNNEEIKWEKNEDGTVYTSGGEEKPTEDASGKKLAGTKYVYRIDVQPQIANVSVVQQTIEPEGKSKKKTGEDARPKTVEEASASLAESKVETGKTMAEEDNSKSSKSKKY